MVAPTPDTGLAIIGCGPAGIGMAVALRASNYRSFVILERADEIGGTWRDNTYPGCACDIPSHLYSYSFAPHSGWSELYPPQPEIRAYLAGVVRSHDLSQHIRFGQSVVRCDFEEEPGIWRILTSDGRLLTSRFVVLASGLLSQIKQPSIVGIDVFEGKMFHSAQWDHDYQLENKNVAVVGTGASAIQFVPHIAPRVRRLTVFQRSAPWIIPKVTRKIEPWQRTAFTRVPPLQRALRGMIFASQEWVGSRLFTGRAGARAAEQAAREYLASQVPDSELRAKLTPDYRIGCKRILLSNDYYPTLMRSNVELVTAAIDTITPHGIRSRGGETRAFDCIILGTGFDVQGVPIEMVGLGGRRLTDDWSKQRAAYLTVAIAGYPNLFLLMGPNSGTGHNSAIYSIETQIQYIMRLLRLVERKKIRWIAPSESAQRSYNQRLQARLARSVWATGLCSTSTYRNADGMITGLWPGLLLEYRWVMSRVDLSAYDAAPAV